MICLKSTTAMRNKPDNIRNYDFFLWEKLKKGDKTALQKIYREHFAGMLDYGMRLVADRDFVKDCIQQVFRDIINRLPSLGNTGNIRYYLLKSLRQNMLDDVKRGSELKRRLGNIEGNGFDYTDVTTGFSGNDSSSIASLSFREKEAMYLKFSQGLNDLEISQMIGLSDASARELLYNALKKYRSYRDASPPQ